VKVLGYDLAVRTCFLHFASAGWAAIGAQPANGESFFHRHKHTANKRQDPHTTTTARTPVRAPPYPKSTVGVRVPLASAAATPASGVASASSVQQPEAVSVYATVWLKA